MYIGGPNLFSGPTLFWGSEWSLGKVGPWPGGTRDPGKVGPGHGNAIFGNNKCSLLCLLHLWDHYIVCF